VHEIDAAYGDLQALWGVSLEVAEREVVTIIGPNGAGKTTLMRTIVGLHRPSRGHVHFQGQDLHRIAAHQVTEAGMILVPEGRRLFGQMTVLENLEMGAYPPRARRERGSTLEQVFSIYPLLAERRRQIASTLSGGQQQMLAIGRALMGLPRLLLLDEPSLGLAPIVVDQIFNVLRLINQQGVAVLLVEQNAHLALQLAHRAYILEGGRVVSQGPGRELLTDPNVQEAYLGYAPVSSTSPPHSGEGAGGRGP
jgi:branched-chain amino acid transport system ATP-binding protein